VENDGCVGMEEEMRVVTMRLSDTSAAISTAFSSDLQCPTEYRYISKPRDVVREKSKRLEDQERAKTEVDRSFGTYGGGDLVYRERTINGGYRIRREKISVGSGVLSRGELLDRRLGKKSDKYC